MRKKRIFDNDKMSKRRKSKLFFCLFGPSISWWFKVLNDKKRYLELTNWSIYIYIIYVKKGYCYTKWKLIYNCSEIYTLHQREYFQLFQKFRSMMMLHAQREKKKLKKWYNSLICLMLLQRNSNTSGISYCSPPQFTFCDCKSTHYPQNFPDDTSNYMQIQYYDTSKI